MAKKKKKSAYGPREWSPRGKEGMHHLNPRAAALSEFLQVPMTEILDTGTEHSPNSFGIEGQEHTEYIVLTDEEANKRAHEDIENSVWAFNANFIIRHSDLPFEAEEMVKFFQEKKCEGANETILTLIKDLDEFVEDAISADGRGHFISHYDGEEHEQGDFFIYRIN